MPDGKWFGWQTPCPSHVSASEQAASLAPQTLPTAGTKAVDEMAGSQTMQGSPARSEPALKQTSLIKHPSQVLVHASVVTSHTWPAGHWLVGVEQVSATSSHVETPLQATPSSQGSAAPVQTPARQASFVVQKSPSSQVAPLLLDQSRELRFGSQIKQLFTGFRARASTQAPSIKQPGQVSSQTASPFGQSAVASHDSELSSHWQLPLSSQMPDPSGTSAPSEPSAAGSLAGVSGEAGASELGSTAPPSVLSVVNESSSMKLRFLPEQAEIASNASRETDRAFLKQACMTSPSERRTPDPFASAEGDDQVHFSAASASGINSKIVGSRVVVGPRGDARETVKPNGASSADSGAVKEM